jgi:hypothetical protein
MTSPVTRPAAVVIPAARRIRIVGWTGLTARTGAGNAAVRDDDAPGKAARVPNGVDDLRCLCYHAGADHDHLRGGPARNRAMSVPAAMSGAGAAVGLIDGGQLTSYLSWRRVLFVNVATGVATAAAAPSALAGLASRRGRLDLAGAVARRTPGSG